MPNDHVVAMCLIRIAAILTALAATLRLIDCVAGRVKKRARLDLDAEEDPLRGTIWEQR